MAIMSQTIYPDAFLWMINFLFWLKFHWSLFLKVQLTKPSIGLDNGLAPNRRKAITWTDDDPVRWHIYEELEGDELKNHPLSIIVTHRIHWKTVLNKKY